jgi:hypothetical protein
MSNVKTLKGSIKVEGYSKGRSTVVAGSPLFSETHDVCGETIGELLDNLVEASAILASSAFTWGFMNRSASYAPLNDKWSITVSFPAVIQSHENHGIFNDQLTCQGTLITFESIVKYAVRVRNEQITQAAFNLILAKVDEPSAISDELQIPLQPAGKQAESFYEITQYGYTGAQLDLILAIAENEGRIQEYNAQNTLMDGFPPREFLPRDKFQENIYI